MQQNRCYVLTKSYTILHPTKHALYVDQKSFDKETDFHDGLRLFFCKITCLAYVQIQNYYRLMNLQFFDHRKSGSI